MQLSGAGLCQPKGQLLGDQVQGFTLATLALGQPTLGKILFSMPAAGDVNSLQKVARLLA